CGSIGTNSSRTNVECMPALPSPPCALVAVGIHTPAISDHANAQFGPLVLSTRTPHPSMTNRNGLRTIIAYPPYNPKGSNATPIQLLMINPVGSPGFPKSPAIPTASMPRPGRPHMTKRTIPPIFEALPAFTTSGCGVCCAWNGPPAGFGDGTRTTVATRQTASTLARKPLARAPQRYARSVLSAGLQTVRGDADRDADVERGLPPVHGYP